MHLSYKLDVPKGLSYNYSYLQCLEHSSPLCLPCKPALMSISHPSIIYTPIPQIQLYTSFLLSLPTSLCTVSGLTIQSVPSIPSFPLQTGRQANSYPSQAFLGYAVLPKVLFILNRHLCQTSDKTLPGRASNSYS